MAVNAPFTHACLLTPLPDCAATLPRWPEDKPPMHQTLARSALVRDSGVCLEGCDSKESRPSATRTREDKDSKHGGRSRPDADNLSLAVLGDLPFFLCASRSALLSCCRICTLYSSTSLSLSLPRCREPSHRAQPLRPGRTSADAGNGLAVPPSRRRRGRRKTSRSRRKEKRWTDRLKNRRSGAFIDHPAVPLYLSPLPACAPRTLVLICLDRSVAARFASPSPALLGTTPAPFRQRRSCALRPGLEPQEKARLTDLFT